MAGLGTLGSAFIDIRANATNLFGDIRTFGLGALAEQVEDVGERIQQVGKDAAKGALIPLGLAVTANITQWQALEKQIQETVTLFGSGGLSVATSQFDELRLGVSELSREMGVLESDIAPALYQSISAGVPRDNVFSFLETAQKVAIGGATDVTSAVDLLTTAMNSFEQQGLTANDAADILFRGVARGKTTIEELSASMARVSPVVAAAGVGFDEFVAIIATMTLAGTQTAEAMTNVRAALTGLTKPSEDLNEIWREAGFATADAAISALGLQGAMQLITDATGGSISKITALVGGMEATNAILQVTGENAGRFNSVLSDTANAAGAADQAFELMQDTTGRAFGAFTAALDRLGSAGGDLADDFVVPVVKALTSAVDNFAEFTKRFTSFVEPIADLWGTFIKRLLDNSAFRFLVSAVGTLVVALQGLKLVVGTVIFAFGGLITVITKLFTSSFVTLAIGGLQKQLGILATLLGRAGNAVSTMGTYGEAAGRGLGKMAAASLKIGRFLNPATLLPIAAAFTAVALAALHAAREYRAAAEAAEFSTTQAEKLAESLGLVARAVADIPTDELTYNVTFAMENEEILDDLRALSDERLQEELRQIGFRFVQLGNSPEEAYEALQKLVRLGGIPIEINFDFIDFENPETLIDSIRNELDLALSEGGILPGGLFYTAEDVGNARSDAKLLADQFKIAFQQGVDTGDFSGALQIIQFLDEIREKFGENSAVARTFANTFADAFNLEQNLAGRDPIGSFIEQLLSSFSGDQLANLYGVRIGDAIVGGAEDSLNGSPIDPSLILPSEEELAQITQRLTALDEFPNKVREVFGNAEAAVAEFAAGVETSLTNSIPIFSVYTGAADIAFGEWLEGQNQLQADLATWTERTAEILEALPPDVARRIQQAPIEQKAWLASLGDDELDEAIAELTETFGLVPDAAAEELEGLQEVMDGIYTTIIDEGMAELVTALDEAGIDSADAWEQAFTNNANWAELTKAQAVAAVKAANDYFDANPIRIPSIDVGPISDVGTDFPTPGPNGPSTNITVNNPRWVTTDGSLQQAAATSSVITGG